MAIVNNGTRVSLPASYLPSGYTAPTVTAVSGSELWVDKTTLTVLKSAIENASAVTGFTALVAAVDTASLALVTDTFDAAETVTFYTDLVALENNQDVASDESSYTTAAENFTATVVIRVKVVDVT